MIFYFNFPLSNRGTGASHTGLRQLRGRGACLPTKPHRPWLWGSRKRMRQGSTLIHCLGPSVAFGQRVAVPAAPDG